MCGCTESEFHDLESLKRVTTVMDELVENVRVQKADKIRHYNVPSKAFKEFNLVTSELVSAFEKDARAHVRYLLDNRNELETLYWLNETTQMFNRMEIDYYDFMLLDSDRENILEKIETAAASFFSKHCLKFDVTCLYLLYFYGLLVNRKATWILLDYMNYGNKFHSYFVKRTVRN